jgi:hypothetical protein
MPFEELRRRSRITEVAQAAANVAEFFKRIREGLPALPARPVTTAPDATASQRIDAQRAAVEAVDPAK